MNNDRLSCFLRNGATLARLAMDTGVTQTMLDPRVVDSPRFVWLPVVEATDRAQKNFQPIRDFVPAFITDETTTSEATVNAVNGLEINGNSVKVLHVFVFNKGCPARRREGTVHRLQRRRRSPGGPPHRVSRELSLVEADLAGQFRAGPRQSSP